MEYIILRNNKDDMIFSYLNDKNLYNTFKYTKNNKFYHMIMKYNLPFKSILFGKWKKKINKCYKVILFDTMMYPCITKYIKKHNKNCEIILYFWNSVNDSNRYLLNDKNIDKYYTFDKENAREYKMSYNSQFYTKNIKLKYNTKFKNDILFLGREKGRKEKLEGIKRVCEKTNLKLDLHIIEKESDLVDYKDYLKMLEESKTILDIVNDYQKGLSLRVLESLFLEKKLITNNKIIKEYDFYDKNNIFILGEDKITDLNIFINTPYKKIDKEIIDKYDYESWLKRFK